MSGITPEMIKQLREKTSCGVMECKRALEEAGSDLEQATEILKQRGLELAAKKGSRDAKEGRIEVYVHPGNKVAVMLELNCETDFVASNESFVEAAKGIAMHIAALSPKYVSREDIPEDVLAQAEDQSAFIKESVLLEQPFVKNPKLTISETVTNLVASLGENISIGRFSRYKVNEIA